MSSNWNEYQRLVLSELERHSKAIEATDERNADIRSDLQLVREQLAPILRILQGNGVQPLSTRLYTIEQKLIGLEKAIAEMKSEVSQSVKAVQDSVQSIQKSASSISQEDVRGKWAMRVAVATGAISLIISLINAFFHH